MFVLAGFYLIYSIEELTHFILDRYAVSTGLETHSQPHLEEVETMMAAEGAVAASDQSIYLCYLVEY